MDTIQKTLQSNEEEQQVKLLILVNDEEHAETIEKLIGPVFQDITKSEDEYDPVTMEPIWINENGKREPSPEINKYFLFSYTDSNGKIRCMSLFSIYDLIEAGNPAHPLTSEPIPEEDIKRATELIELYKDNVGLFTGSVSYASPEFKLKNRISRLFKKFHTHSIFFEEKWLMDLSNENDLNKIITETQRLISSNETLLRPDNNNSTINAIKSLFSKAKQSNKKPTKSSKKAYSDSDSEFEGNNILRLQTYIVEQWEKMIEIAGPQNQLAIWIIAHGLATIVKEIYTKFPDMEYMIN
jgi:hypothetical protein